MAALTENWCKTYTNVAGVSFKWIITNFSKRPETACEVLKSSTFSSSHNDNYAWCLHLYPNGISAYGNTVFVALYLEFASERTQSNSNVKIDYTFSLSNNQNEEKNIKRASNRVGVGRTTGFDDFIDRNFLLNEANGLLTNDTLAINCHISTTLDTVTYSSEKILIKEANCECKLSQDIAHLFKNERFKDVTFIVDNRRIGAHKIILATRSPVFDAMFGHEMVESKLNSVSITDISYEVIQEMLRYIYTGKVSNLSTMAEELLIAAEKYALKDLKELCELELGGRISVETAADMLILADLYSAGKLKAQIIKFINAHISEVLATHGWKNMKTSHRDLIVETLEEMALWSSPPSKPSKNN